MWKYEKQSNLQTKPITLLLSMELGFVWRLKPDLLALGFECPLPDTRDGLAGIRLNVKMVNVSFDGRSFHPKFEILIFSLTSLRYRI